MKQHIFPEDLATLTPEQKEKLRELWKPQEGDPFTSMDSSISVKHVIDVDREEYIYDGRDWIPKGECFPLLSIGQCLELLAHRLLKTELTCSGWEVTIITQKCDEWKFIKKELIDALFEAVKAIL